MDLERHWVDGMPGLRQRSPVPSRGHAHGVATTDRRPIAGAMVTAFNEPGNRKEMVFTGADVRYALRTSFDGKLSLRTRTTSRA